MFLQTGPYCFALVKFSGCHSKNHNKLDTPYVTYFVCDYNYASHDFIIANILELPSFLCISKTIAFSSVDCGASLT